ncbi:dTDP-4-dehydrorhamnose 3,5-epimerase [Leptolyngbya sp. FACHB-261]|uniref:dTDP-4-dehydrorhamnose 3,5-epimerase n=1 Tax=Leptolyngbya sp. FACHB-261 TaxID=2692806 RepID=UPI001682F71F|nr:dTDP-4-dehydrorhamnose 3,5-epimerase [Leptolyngbya sp. FACHB-261]MBD2102622.1 dTDP-4-dehydrorhamnose 3,5-epimerase [Leptolyngbya sp. FACHB-261]
MIFTETSLKRAFLIELEKLQDQRGFFARTWCQREFAVHGLNIQLAQCSISHNQRQATLRGMHYQISPYEETKLVRCLKGAICDVIIDLRPGSPTFKQHYSVVLSAENYKMLYIPEGFAHGFQTLEDDTEVFYQISEFYHAESARGIRWNDPAFNINWPLEVQVISERDQQYPDFDKNIDSFIGNTRTDVLEPLQGT